MARMTEKTRILLVFPHNPFVQSSGVKSRFYSLIRRLKENGLAVDLFSLTHFEDVWPPETTQEQKLVGEIFLFDFRRSGRFENLFSRVVSRLKKMVCEQKVSNLRQFPDLAFPEMQTMFNSILSRKKYDIVLISYVHWARLLEGVKFNGVKILTIEDFITANLYERWKGKIDVGQCLGEEIRLVNLFDRVICISPEEMSFFQKFCPKPEFHHVPHFLPRGTVSPSQTFVHDIIYVGSNNPFNKEGMTWFFQEVYPLLSQKIKIAIIGGVNQHLSSFKAKCPNVDFIDYVERTDDYYAKSRIAICPILGGTGLKVKVVEALSFGLPVVCTSYGVVGMNGAGGNGCLVADSAADFAGNIHLLLQDADAYKKFSKDSLDYFMNNFESETVCKKLDAIFS